MGGAVLGILYVLGVPYFASDVSPHLGLLSSGVGLLVLVLFLPGGFMRALLAIRDRFAKLITGIEVRS